LFACVGVPDEIRAPTSLRSYCRKYTDYMKPIHTTPHHSKTDGLVERFNHTLKGMLRKAANEEGKNWDQLLPYLLFAYREVPQASTGFSPFEHLNGCNVLGSLDILQESWEASRKSSDSIISHVLCVQERLLKLRALNEDEPRTCTTSTKGLV
jgi:transposase InsO family protein